MAGSRKGAAVRVKAAAIVMALFLVAGQVTACAHRGAGDEGSERESWMDTEVLIAAGVIMTVIAAGVVAASEGD